MISSISSKMKNGKFNKRCTEFKIVEALTEAVEIF